MKRMKQWGGDLLLLGGALLFGALIALFLLLSGKEGEQVQVRVAGEVVVTLPLDRDCTYEIAGAEGGWNRLVIAEGSAWMEDASCPDKLCVHTGKIHQAGQAIVCLPNQVVVEIAGETASAEVDMVAG